jgi:replicative DNA helicase
MTAAVADLDVPFARSAQHDIGAEQGVLGGMLLAKDVIAEVMEILKSQDFYRPVHASIFDTILELHGRGEPADALTVAGVLADSGELQRVGGVPYLHTLIESVPTAANATYYARIVADQAVLRSLDEACVKIRQMIHSRSVPPSELVETARTMVADLAGGLASTDGPVRWADLITPGLDAIETLAETRGVAAGTPTGFVDLDRLINGIQPGKVYVIAGESGSGKSTLASDFVRSAAFTHQQGTVVFNLEMSSLELFNRFVCAHAGVPHHALTSGTMSDHDWSKVAHTCGDTENAPLWIDDSPNLTVADIRVRTHKLKQQHNLQMVVVDLIGLVTPSGPNLPRQEQVAGISRKFKQLAKELQVAVVVVAQINRGPQQRSDKRPSIHDLRESAQIGHDADAVILVYRPEKHDRDTPRRGEADLIVDKNRFGPEDTITVCAQLHMSRFASMAIA